jgi:hypothetical protein
MMELMGSQNSRGLVAHMVISEEFFLNVVDCPYLGKWTQEIQGHLKLLVA